MDVKAGRSHFQDSSLPRLKVKNTTISTIQLKLNLLLTAPNGASTRLLQLTVSDWHAAC